MDLATRIHLHDGKMTVQRSQDCVPIAERCKALVAAGATGSGEMKLAASIPYVLIEDYCNRNGIEFSEWIRDPAHARRMLADPALAHFRVWKGKL